MKSISAILLSIAVTFIPLAAKAADWAFDPIVHDFNSKTIVRGKNLQVQSIYGRQGKIKDGQLQTEIQTDLRLCYPQPQGGIILRYQKNGREVAQRINVANMEVRNDGSRRAYWVRIGNTTSFDNNSHLVIDSFVTCDGDAPI
jgi:hypothetical protein